MYVIPFYVLRRFLGDAASLLEREHAQGSITISLELFRRLLHQALLTHPLEKEAYLEANPDVASGIRRGDFISGQEHYAKRGYFEDRSSLRDEFDEEWYVKGNPDVERAIRSGEYPSGKAHFLAAGIYEFRAPSGECEADMNSWRSSLRQTAGGSSATTE